MISKFIGIPNHFEVIVISIIAICVLSLDVSVSTLQENLQEIWNYDFGETVREEDVEVYLKYSLSGVVLLKALTLHLFLALHFLLLWTATVEEQPNLILPWLLLGVFRSIFLNFLGFSTGLYVCMIQKGYHPICLEYVSAQAIQHGPEVYAWLSVFRNVITESAIDNVINHIKRIKPTQCPSRSLDALINLKSSKIRKNYYEIEDGHESIPEKVMRILNVVYDDIKKARIAKENRLPWKITDLNLEKLLVSERSVFPVCVVRSKMVYEIRGKVAVITGGASGIGLEYAKELLKNEAKGVVLSDLNPEFGAKALQEIEKEFGPNKAIFSPTDVTDYKQFENAFKKAVEKYKNVDILINNAGLLNDAVWQKEIAINVNGVVHGMLLGMDNYLPKYKQGDEAVIVNISSTAGIEGYGHVPVYCATKHAVHGMTRSWGVPEFYEETKVRVVGVHPGVTNTPLIFNMAGSNLGGKYEAYLKKHIEEYPTQEPNFVAKEVMKVIKKAPHGSSWVVEGGEPAYQFIMPDRTTMKKNTLP